MVCDKECLILLHRLRQFLKISLSELPDAGSAEFLFYMHGAGPGRRARGT
jgi:hypothetical protein